MASSNQISFMADRKQGLIGFLKECVTRQSWDEAIIAIRHIQDVEHQIRVGRKIREIIENDGDVRDLRRRDRLRVVTEDC